MRDIKTKQKVLSIKTKDVKGNVKHFVKQQTIHTRNKEEGKKVEQSVKTNPNVQATNNVNEVAKQTFIESKQRAKKFIKHKHREHRFRNTDKNALSETVLVHNQRITYVSKAKHHVVNKINTSKIKQTADKVTTQPVVKSTTKVIKTSIEVVKKSVSAMNTLFSFGTGLILLLVVTLFIGTFSVLAQDGGSNSEIVSLSEEVIAYEDTIRKYAKEYDIEDYVSLLLAIMMQESGGKGNDPMQASESGYNIKYPRVPNGITDPEYSIEVGTRGCSEC